MSLEVMARGRLGALVKFAAGFAAVMGAAWYLDLQERLDELDTGESRLASLKTTYVTKWREAGALESYRQQLVEIERTFGPLLTQMPIRIGTDAAFIDIMQAAAAREVRIDHLERPDDEVQREFHAEVAGNIRVSGSYRDLGSFVNDLASMPGMVALHDLKLAGTAGVVTLEAVMKTHRFLDEEEVAAKRKAARKGKKK